MSGNIPQEILDEILSRINIVELISGFIPLKRAGRNFKALCPFHQEKTPSFMVNPDKQIYHCFGCNAGGNAFNFLMRYERIEFPEAVQELAKRANVVLPHPTRQDKSQGINSLLYKINELAAIFYQDILNSKAGLEAKNYLLSRGVKLDSLKTLKLGYAPHTWDSLLNHLRSKNISLSLIEKSGLIIPKQGGGYYDRFRNRIIFPIMDVKNRILAFGARILPGKVKNDDLAKYVNSPETPVYIKGKNLFGLNLAKEKISELDYCLIVEGYLDFLITYQEGIHNVVASQGTALTGEQVRLLKRYTHNIVMVYDGDSAGELATLRSLDIFLEEDLEVRVVDLPSGFDPDTFIRKFGINEFEKRIDQAKTLFDYKLDILKSRYNHHQVQSKAKIADEMLSTISKFKNAILKSEYLKRLAESLNVKEDALVAELKKIKPDTYSILPQRNFAKNRIIDINPTERLLLKLMLEESHLIESLKGILEPADFQDELAVKVVSIIFDLISKGKPIEPSQLINYFREDDISSLIAELLLSTDAPEDERRREIILDCIQRLKHQRLRLKREQLLEEIKLAEGLKDDERLNKLTQEFHQLTRGGVKER